MEKGSRELASQVIASIEPFFDSLSAHLKLNNKSKAYKEGIPIVEPIRERESSLINAVCQFEFHQRQILDEAYKICLLSENADGTARKDEARISWTEKTEKMLSIYSFNFAIEEISTAVMELDAIVTRFAVQKPRIYWPFKKWLHTIPFINQPSRQRWSFRKLDLVHAKKFFRSSESVFALKAASAIVLVLSILANPNSREFFTTYNLTGCLIMVHSIHTSFIYMTDIDDLDSNCHEPFIWPIVLGWLL
jgi:hypothetical protein